MRFVIIKMAPKPTSDQNALNAKQKGRGKSSAFLTQAERNLAKANRNKLI